MEMKGVGDVCVMTGGLARGEKNALREVSVEQCRAGQGKVKQSTPERASERCFGFGLVFHA